jgi:GNAT superfamily N-acetyltransferase
VSGCRIEPLQARLAVVIDRQGQGLGAALLKDAIGRTLAAASSAGIRSLAVHAKDERARGFYEHFGIRPSPSEPLQLVVLLKGCSRPRPHRQLPAMF